MRFASPFVVVVLLVTIVSCADDSEAGDPTGPAGLAPAAASVFIDNTKFPVNILVFIPCADGGAGEDVALTGFLHVLLHVTINGDRFVVKEHFQPQGITGLGLSTGDKYQGTGVTQETYGGFFVNGQFSDTFVNNFRIIGQGNGNNLLVHDTFHLTLNAKGEVTVVLDNFSIDCK